MNIDQRISDRRQIDRRKDSKTSAWYKGEDLRKQQRRKGDRRIA